MTPWPASSHGPDAVADALKDFFSPAMARRLAASVAAVHPPFDAKRFVADATKGLTELELKARALHMAVALRAHLPRDYREALGVLLASLGPKHATDELEGAGMAPFFYMPHVTFVAEYGLDAFDASMEAQHALTQRFTAEFSVRPFIDRDPERALAFLARWARDPNPHVRRLVSEGTRPRLPWASRVRFVDEEPARFVALLETLKDDPNTMVRRSVANHLNDLTKSQPDLALEVAARWLKDATAERRKLVEHALRWSVKQGNAEALALLGFGEKPRVRVTGASFAPSRVPIGKSVRVTFNVVAKRGGAAQRLAVDLAVHFVKARGARSAKVFKVAKLDLAPKEGATLSKTISLAVHTTRKPNVGEHEVVALVNGAAFPLGAFVVVRR